MSNETDGWHVYNQRKDIVEENPIDISFLLNHLFLVVQWLSPTVWSNRYPNKMLKICKCQTGCGLSSTHVAIWTQNIQNILLNIPTYFNIPQHYWHDWGKVNHPLRGDVWKNKQMNWRLCPNRGGGVKVYHFCILILIS